MQSTAVSMAFASALRGVYHEWSNVTTLHHKAEKLMRAAARHYPSTCATFAHPANRCAKGLVLRFAPIYRAQARLAEQRVADADCVQPLMRGG